MTTSILGSAIAAPFLASLSLATLGRADKHIPRGHLEPFGSWTDGRPIDERFDVPEPEEFYNEYCDYDKGYGKPVVFRGAANSMTAVSTWSTDDQLLEQYSKEKVSGVEYNLKETRAGGQVDGMNTMGQFLKAYNTSDIYLVSQVPKGMHKDIDFLPCMRCGGYLNYLDTNNLWIGRGGSKSVIHYDDQDNINCMIAGSKRFVFMHPSWKAKFEAHPNSNKNKFGWVDTDLDRSVKGYGAFFGKIDVDKMDLMKYPGWIDVEWSYVDLQPGDCVYIPYQWYHQVTAMPVRSINVHIWYWRPAKFNKESCDAQALAAPPPTLADCTYGYEPPRGHLGPPKAGKKPFTQCGARGTGPPAKKTKKRRKGSGSEL